MTNQPVITDANIFLDLLSVGLLDSFCLLPTKIVTSDFVIHEILPAEDIAHVDSLIAEGRIDVIRFSFAEMSEIIRLQNLSGVASLSIPDCSVLYLAKKTDCTLLTGDRKLRNIATAQGIKVAGTLYVFDRLVDSGIVSPPDALERMELLLNNNRRLPVADCLRMMQKWR